MIFILSDCALVSWSQEIGLVIPKETVETNFKKKVQTTKVMNAIVFDQQRKPTQRPAIRWIF